MVEFDKYCIRRQDPNNYSDTLTRALFRYAPLKSDDPVNGGRPDHFAVEEPTFSPKLMVFCGIKRDGTFGLKFYRNENMTGASYHRLLQFDVLPQLRAWNGGNLDGIFWQQDGQRGFLFRLFLSKNFGAM